MSDCLKDNCSSLYIQVQYLLRVASFSPQQDDNTQYQTQLEVSAPPSNVFENDALFAPMIDFTTEYVTSTTTELVSKFKDIGTNLSPAGLTKEKQQKQNLLIKSLKLGKHVIKFPCNLVREQQA